MENELSGRSRFARSITCDHVASAASSKETTAIVVHSTFPQLWKPLGGRAAPRGGAVAVGEARRTIAPPFSTSGGRAALLTVFLVHDAFIERTRREPGTSR